MITTDQVAGPPTPHAVNVVDTSSSVKPESHFEANMVNAHVNSSRSAMVDLTHAFMGNLPDGRTVMVAPAPPAPPALPVPAPSLQIIPADGLMGLMADFALDITPKGEMQ